MDKSKDTEALFAEYRETKDTDLRNELVEHYLPLVGILASKYANKGIDYDDLYQTGSMALLHAVERFDPTKGFKFESFATPTIIGEIKRYFRDKGWALKVPRQLKEIATQLADAQDRLYIELRRQPTAKEIGDCLGHTEEKILEAMESRYSFQALSLNQALESDDSEENSVHMEQFIGVEEGGFEGFENASMIKNVLDTLDEREKVVFNERILNGSVQKELAKEFGISQMTLSRMEKKIREKFKKEFGK